MTRHYFNEAVSTRLDNGITIVVDRAPGMQTLAVEVAVRVGSCDEEGFPEGIAHFAEHMAFKGTARRSADDISLAIMDRGGYINATTDQDTTSYTCETVAEELASALDVLADVVISPRLDPEAIEIERSVILEEEHMGSGSWSTFEECYLVSAFGEQAIARPVIGTEAGISAVTAENLRAFRDRNYISGNVIVAVAGDVTFDAVRDLVVEKFADLPVGPRTRLPHFDYIGGEQGFACSCERGIVRYGFRGLEAGSVEAQAIRLFCNILAGGPTSRLFKELRDKRGLVYDVSPAHFAACGTHVVGFETQSHASKIREVFLVMDDLLHEAASNISADEIERARRHEIAYERMSRDRMRYRTQDVVFHLVEQNRVANFEQWLAKLDRVDVDLMRASATAMLDGPATLAVHGPARGMPRLDQRRKPEVAAKVA